MHISAIMQLASERDQSKYDRTFSGHLVKTQFYIDK